MERLMLIPTPKPTRPSLLSTGLGVNGLVVCDCGQATFKVGIAYNERNGNNFLRLLECTSCGHQMPATHKADDGLSPSITQRQGSRE